MAGHLQAFKTPSVLARVATEVPEPYRTLLLVHPFLANGTLSREVLVGVLLRDVGIEGEVVRIEGKVLHPTGAKHLLEYLRGWLVRQDQGAGYLFPLPSDPNSPANVSVCKRHLRECMSAKPRASEIIL